MKIVHICVCGPYTDGWNYQENMLTKFHRAAGYEVSMIVSQWAWGNNGVIEEIRKTAYVNDVGVTIYRLPIKNGKNVFYRYKRFLGFYEKIEEIKPDIIFVHNLQFFDIDQIVRYAKKYDVTIYADNHADFTNSARSVAAKGFYKIVWRYYAQLIEPFTKKFYGVLPSRVDFLMDIYKLPKEKCELLVMGGDDDLVKNSMRPEVKARIREQYGIHKKDFLIVTGGKIDQFKTQTLLLMKAVKNLGFKNVKLLVFGSVATGFEEEVYNLCEGSRIQYAGWVQANKSYDYFAAADLVVFPGRHSVFWEQVVAQGIPMIIKKWPGIYHIDLGGNVLYLYEDSVEEIQELIVKLLSNSVIYQGMKKNANSDKRKNFLYNEIAKRCIE